MCFLLIFVLQCYSVLLSGLVLAKEASHPEKTAEEQSVGGGGGAGRGMIAINRATLIYLVCDLS